MTVGASLLSFAMVAGLVTLTPGLDTALVLRASLRDGRRAGLVTTLGVNAGVLCWGLAAALGVSALLSASHVAYDVLRYVGAAYLVWLGARLLGTAIRGERARHGRDERGRDRDRAEDNDSEDGADHLAPGHDASPASGWAHFRSGLLTNLLNPKVGAFYVAMLPQFLPAGVPTAVGGAMLALVHNAEGLLWLGLVAACADAFRRHLTRPGVARAVDGCTGTVLVAFGARLALSPR